MKLKYLTYLCLLLIPPVLILANRKESKLKFERCIFDTIGVLQTNNLTLALEDCSSNAFNFCNNGTDLGPRITPVFVKLNPENLTESYNDTVFVFSSVSILYRLIEMNKIDSIHWNLDALFTNKLNDSNMLDFYNVKYKRIVKKYIRKNNIHIAFDGHLRYYLYKMKVKYCYVGIQTIQIPNIQATGGLLYKSKLCHVYSIIDVDSIIPIKMN